MERRVGAFLGERKHMLGRMIVLASLLAFGIVGFGSVVPEEAVPLELVGSADACMGDICDGINEVCKIAFRGRDCVG